MPGPELTLIVPIMAHELGADYVWHECEKARHARDNRRLQELADSQFDTRPEM